MHSVLFKAPSTQKLFFGEKVLCVSADRPHGSGIFAARKCTFLKQQKNTLCVSVLKKCKRCRIAPHQLGDVRVVLHLFFYLYSFCSFKYSPLVNVITNCTLKSISAQSKRFNNCFLLLYSMRPGLMRSTFLWRTSTTQWP